MDNQQIGNTDESSGENVILSKEDEIFQTEIEELEKCRREHEEKKKEQLERTRKERERNKRGSNKDSVETPSIVEGQVTPTEKRTYAHEIKLFKHRRLNDFSGRGFDKINKTLKSVHGVSAKKKIEFIKALKAYNPSKSVLKKNDFVDFARRFKSKRFVGQKFSNVAKEGIDIKEMRKTFGKRDIDKLRRGITGEDNPNKYKLGSSGLRKSTPPPANSRLGR